MKLLWSAFLYTCLALGANGVGAGPVQDVINAGKGETLRALAVHSAPRPLPAATFNGPNGPVALSDWRGKVVVLNFWAIWCAPCREEMPTLSALQAEFGGDDFSVITLATGPNALPAITKFYAEIEVTNLPTYRDPKSKLARGAGVFGLPVTLILDRQGNEVARLVGPADWYSDAARTIVDGLLALP